ncbi:MAG: hypothetical protein Q9216_005740 [Gyalolechia sp. 2 TL-2023]
MDDSNPCLDMAMLKANGLWDKAVDRLGDQDRQLVNFSQCNKLLLLSDVLQATELGKQSCMQKRWKYTRKNGDVVVLRDVCEKIIKWVHKFKEIGDVAVQYDPAHASLPWAAIRFLLQLSVNDVQIFSAVADGLETVSGYITRCTLYEHLYLSKPSSARAELELTLLRLYTAILTYLARARRHYDKGTIRRLGASVIDSSESLDICLSKIAVERDDVDRCIHLIDSELLRDVGSTVSRNQAMIDTVSAELQALITRTSTLQKANHVSMEALCRSLEQPLLRTASHVSDLHVELQREERQKILTWLSTVRYRQHHRSSISAVMPGSCLWLQQKQEYVEWKTSSCSSILWIHGIPGFGKSKLVSTVIQGLLENKAQDKATSAVAYFYCARDAAELQRADPDEIMRAVLKQIAYFDTSKPINRAVFREYDKRRRDAEEDGLDPLQFSFSECKDMILQVTDQLPVVIVIDALDECNPMRRYALIQALLDIVQQSSSLVKIMVSSRDDADIVFRLNHCPNVYIRPEDNGEDLAKYIDHELEQAISEQRLLKGRVPAFLKERIQRELKGGAHGMFLWASLQIQNLCDPERIKVASDVEEALLQLPETLLTIYKAIMDRIDRTAVHGRAWAKKALRWLLCAREPLTSETLVEMVGLRESDNPKALHLLKDEVLSLCCNLVVLDNYSDVFRFAHASIREFLEVQPEFEYQVTNLQAAAEALMFVQSERTAIEGAFARYATKYWLFHYRNLDLHFRTENPLSSSVKAFFLRGTKDDSIYQFWESAFITHTAEDEIQSMTTAVRPVQCYGPLYLACGHGLIEVVDELTNNQAVDLDERNHLGETGLYIAAHQCHSAIVERLLKLGADQSITTSTNGTALHRAAENGDQVTLSLLLQHQADVVFQDDQGLSALDWATRNEREAIVRLLVQCGAREEVLQKYGQPLVLWIENTRQGTPGLWHRIHRATGCVGIKNEGQTGFLNAILHLMYTLQPFCNLPGQIPSADIAGEHPIVTALGRFFTLMETSEKIMSTRELTSAFGWGTDKLQQPDDAFELFVVLMDHVATAMGGSPTNTAFDDLFNSEIVHALGRVESARYITVDVNGNRSLKEAISEWVVQDDPSPLRQGQLRWSFKKLSPILVFNVQRFCYDMDAERIDKASFTRWMVHSLFTYPSRLTLDQKDEPFQISYTLHGVLVHQGYHASGGKIFIYLKSHRTGKWILCRNEHVIWTTAAEAFEGNFGSDGEPVEPFTSRTATALVYLDENRIHEVAKDLIPFGE